MTRSRTRTDTGRLAIVPLWLLEAGVSARGLHLYTVLAAKYADKEGDAFPSRRTLAEDLDVTVRTVDAAIQELVGLGALSVERRKNASGDWTSSLYTVHRVRQEVVQPIALPDEGGSAADCTTSCNELHDVVQPVAHQEPDSTDPDPIEPEQHTQPPVAPLRLVPPSPTAGQKPAPRVTKASPHPVYAALNSLRDEYTSAPAPFLLDQRLQEWSDNVTLEDIERVRQLNAAAAQPGWRFCESVLGRVASDREHGRDPWREPTPRDRAPRRERGYITPSADGVPRSAQTLQQRKAELVAQGHPPDVAAAMAQREAVTS